MTRIPVVRVTLAAIGGLAAVGAMAAFLFAISRAGWSPSASLGAVGWIVPLATGATVGVVGWLLLADLDDPSPEAETSVEIECPSCGAHIRDSWRLCPHCGSLVEGKSSVGDCVATDR